MNKETKQLIILGILFVILAGSLVFLNAENEKRKSQIFQLKDNIESYKNLPSSSEISRKSSELKSKQEKLEPFLLDGQNPLSFIEMIENVAKDFEVTAFVDDAESYRLYEELDALGGEIVLGVSVTGGLEDIRDFIFEVENMDKEVSISSIRFSKNTEEKSSVWQAFFIIVGKTK